MGSLIKVCKCGCGEEFPEVVYYDNLVGRYRCKEYVQGHNGRMYVGFRPRFVGLCQCGCGLEVLQKYSHYVPRFLSGHCGRVPEIRDRRRVKMLGWLPWNTGLTRISDRRVDIIGSKLEGRKLSVLARRKKSTAMRVKWAVDAEYRNRMSAVHRRTSKAMWDRYTPEERRVRLSKWLVAVQKKPTSYEVRLSELVKLYKLPYLYVGNKGRWFTGNGEHMNPDFVHFYSRIVVEVYGIWQLGFWKPLDYESCRSKCFSSIGYEVIFITNRDLYRFDWKEVCLSKLGYRGRI